MNFNSERTEIEEIEELREISEKVKLVMEKLIARSSGFEFR